MSEDVRSGPAGPAAGPSRVSAMLRGTLGAAGLAAIAVGAWVLFVDARDGTPGRVAPWLLGVLVVHDALLVPLVLLLGPALRRLPGRGALRGGLLAGGCATLVALPAIRRPGAVHDATTLPLDYPRNLALVLGAVALATAVALLVRRLRRVRRAES